MKYWNNDGATAVDVRESEQRLAAIVPGDKPESLMNALEPCMRAAAGLLMVVKPGRTMSVTHHSLRVPQELLDGWMRTQPAYFEQSLIYAIRSGSGDFWQGRHEFSEQLLKGLEVMAAMGGFGLGEGAGLKIDEQPLAGGGTAHVALAVMTHRGEQFPHRTTDVCQALAPALRKAVLRLNLPFTAGRSIHAQVLEDDNVGFVCLNANGAVIEVNQRAYQLASRYRGKVGLGSGNFSMQAFVEMALQRTLASGTWQLTHPDRQAMMQVRAYSMPGEKFELAQDLPMLKLEEWSLLPDEKEQEQEDFVLPPEFLKLTPRQCEIAMLLVNSGLSAKQISSKLDISEKTVRKHVENMHKTLNVHSLGELVARIRKSRN